MRSDKRLASRGLTLLEMVIVVLVIGLITGGIMAGRSMIRASQLQAALGEYDSYLKAIKEFQDKYQALPGDMVGAQALWGTDSNTCPDTTATTTPQTATCDGNGDGTIGSSTTAGVLSNQAEWFHAWQQLADAGIIAGSFTGVNSAGGASEAKPGQNIPQSKLPGAGWTLFYFLNSATSTSYWGQQYGHLLWLGAFDAANVANTPVLTATEAQGLDAKIDDGLPGTGKVQVPRTVAQANCTTNDTSQTAATYNTSASASNASAYTCSPFFILGF